MRKLLVLFLLLVLVYNSIGFIINYEFVLTEWQHEMKQFLSKNMDEKKLTRLVFNSKDFDKTQKEFSHDNKLYDVVKTENLDDKIIVYCFSDEEETRIAENFSEQLFENNSTINFSKNNFEKKIKNFFKNIFSEFFFQKIFLKKNISENFPEQKNIFCYTQTFFSKFSWDVIAPPPEF